MGMDQISESNELKRRNIALTRAVSHISTPGKKHGDSNSVLGDGESSRWYPPMRTDQRAIQHRDKILKDKPENESAAIQDYPLTKAREIALIAYV